MATIKLYLDTRRKRADGTFSIRLSVNHHGGTAFISLNQHVRKDEWDKNTGRVKKRPDKDAINDYLLDRLSFYNKMLMRALSRYDFRGNITATELRDRILDEATPKEEKKVTLYEMFERYKSREMRASTRNNYTYTWNAIEDFSKTAKRIALDEVNREWLEQFNTYLIKRGLARNSRVMRFRCICAVFNYAIDNELTTNYPFRRFNLSMSETKNRDLSVEEIRAAFDAHVEPSDIQFRDLFKLVFLLIGINANDLYNLTVESVVGDRLEYERLKTKKKYSIKLLPEAKKLIEQYKGEKKLLSICERYKSYQSFFNSMSNALHTIREGLSLYYARHTWATLAFKLGISKDTISMALGHSFGIRVTSTYINADLSRVDEANRRVVDWVLYDKK